MQIQSQDTGGLLLRERSEFPIIMKLDDAMKVRIRDGAGIHVEVTGVGVAGGGYWRRCNRGGDKLSFDKK